MSSVAFFLLLFTLALLLAEDEPVAVETAFADPTTDPKNHPPVAVASIQEDPVDLWTNMTIKFTSAGSYDIDGEGRISFIWDFDDGSDPSYLAYPIHVYKEPGTYTVTLTVIDQKSVIAVDTFILVVQQDYGDTDIIIKALEPKSKRWFLNPASDLMAPVAVKRDGWVAYLCDLDKGDTIRVQITIIGDRPVDVYLFNHEEILSYKDGAQVDIVASEVMGYGQGVTGDFAYIFSPPKNGRYYIVIDNKDWPPGTDTEGPVDYTILIDPLWMTDGQDDSWDYLSIALGPIVGMSVVLVAMVVVVVLLKGRERS